MLKLKKLEEVPEEPRKLLVRVASNILGKVMENLLPCDIHVFIKVVAEQIGLMTDKDGVLEKDIYFSKTGSRKTIIAMYCCEKP